jgi:uncharacterized membrane protein
VYYFLAPEFPDATYFKEKIKKGEGAITFRFPLLFYLSKPLYSFFGSITFLVLPALFVFGGFGLLAKLFLDLHLKLRWLAIATLTAFPAFHFLVFFTRDSLIFFLSCATAYFFFNTIYVKEWHYWKIAIIAAVALLAGPQTIIFFALLLFLKAKGKGTRLLVPSMRAWIYFFVFFLFFIGLFIAWFKTDAYLGVFSDLGLKGQYFAGFSNATNLFFNPIIFLMPLANWFYLAALACLALKPNKLFAFFFFGAILLGAVSIANLFAPMRLDNNPEQLALRYSFVFAPFLFFFMAKALQSISFRKQFWHKTQ